MSAEGRVFAPSFHRLKHVRAVHSRRRRRFVIVVMLGVTLAAGVGLTTLGGTSFEHSEPRHAEPAAAFPDQTEVAPTLIDSEPLTVGPVPATTPAPGVDSAAAERPAQKRGAAGRRLKHHTVGAMPDRATRETTIRAPADQSASDADPAAVIEWLLQASRAAKP